jgi:hypothetical protein
MLNDSANAPASSEVAFDRDRERCLGGISARSDFGFCRWAGVYIG